MKCSSNPPYLVVSVPGPRLRGENELGEVEGLLGVLLGGELADHARDLGPLVLGALLREPRPQVPDRQREVLDRVLEIYSDCQ